MSAISIILFVLSIIVIGTYIGPLFDFDEEDDLEFSLFDIILVAESSCYFLWFVYSYIYSFV